MSWISVGRLLKMEFEVTGPLMPSRSMVTDLERRLISEAMQATVGNQSETARRLGISRVGLIKNLTRLGLK